MNTWSSGKSTKVGPVCGVVATANASSTSAGISAVDARRRRVLHERAHERHVVDLLQRALAPAEGRRAAAEHEHRRVVLLRGGERAHAVGDARARRSAPRRPARA